jgi:maleylacetate reductase
MMMSSAHPERLSSFVYSSKPARVIFGSGMISRLGDELATACISRPLFLSSPQQLRRVDEIRTKAFKGGSACHFAGAVMHTPVEVTEQALSLALKNQVDGIVAIGGGSTIGLAKAVALRTDLPQLVVPTTYAGSEMTAILGETRDGIKSTRSDPRILPEVVLYDVDLTLTLPPEVAAASGVNAMAHAVEALYARERNPIISMIAQEAIRALARALPQIVSGGALAREPREDALYGAWLGGVCLGSVGMALHHKLCHVLGGLFNLPHAETHAILLPHAFAYNAAAAPAASSAVASALGVADASNGLYRLARRLGLPQSLRDIGMPGESLDKATDEVFRSPYWNPRPLERGPIRELIARAFDGASPSEDDALASGRPAGEAPANLAIYPIGQNHA